MRGNSKSQANYQQRQGGDEIVGTMRFLKQQWEDTKLIVLSDRTTVKAEDPEGALRVDFTYRFSGRWYDHPKYGRQFFATTFATDTPVSRAGVVAYLQQYVNGIGPARAAALYEAYGQDAIGRLRESPAEVARTVDGISYDVAVEAAQALRMVRGNEVAKAKLLGLFKGRGLGEVAIQACLNKWGNAAPDVIERDPFKMMTANIHNAGFLRCDAIYKALGLPPLKMKRLMLAAWYALHCDRDGHTWFPESKAKQVIPTAVEAIELGVRSGWIARRTDDDGKVWITEAEKATEEAAIVHHLARLMSWRPPAGDQRRLLWPAVEDLQGVSDHQRSVASETFIAPVVVLCGSPGTGKTHVAAAAVRAICRIDSANAIAVIAPTGKAAVRVKVSMRKAGIGLDATTVHKLLQIGLEMEDLRSDRQEDPVKGKRYIIIDEGSMMTTGLFALLLSRLPTGTHVLIIGDPYQLPPVGHGCPLRDLIRSGAVPVGELTEIQRNSGMIVRACKAIKDGQDFETAARWAPETGENLRLLDGGTPEDTLAGVINILEKIAAKEFPVIDGKPAATPLDKKWDIQVLVAMNSRSPISRVPVNKYLQDALNKDGWRVEHNQFRVGDKVICLKNSKLRTARLESDLLGDPKDVRKAESYADTGEEAYVANGEIGEAIAVANHQTIVRFTEPDRLVRVLHAIKKKAKDREDADVGDDDDKEDEGKAKFDLAYAVTVHKAQGSEWRAVIILVDPNAGFVCSREHVYTSISRARELCVLIGSRNKLRGYCYRTVLDKRKTFLVEDLCTNGIGGQFLGCGGSARVRLLGAHVQASAQAIAQTSDQSNAHAHSAQGQANGTTSQGPGATTAEHDAARPRVEV